MDRRLLLAIGLMFGVIVVTNLLFPPRRPEAPISAPDTARVQQVSPEAGLSTGEGEEAPAAQPPAGEDAALREPAPAAVAATREARVDTIVVETPLLRLSFVTRGAQLVSLELPRYKSYEPADPQGASVQLVRGGDHLFGFRVAAGPDTVDLSERRFEASARRVRLDEGTPRDSLTFRYTFASGERGPIVFRVTYHFEAHSYQVRVEGAFEGIGGRGYTLYTSLGTGLRTNEVKPKEDFGQLAFVVKGRRGGIRSEKLSTVASGEVTAPAGGPFDWVAVKNKYFVAAYLAPPESPGFGGLVVTGLPEEHSARITATLPVPAGEPSFAFEAYFGPQDYGRLKAIGHDLQNVNPVGWRWLQPVIRPLVAIVMGILTWMHTTLSLAYGWVLILFGVLMRIVLFPLYQKSMRAQMGQMQVQPLMKDIREKYKDDPQKMQQEIMRLYKEHGINPLAGCLPMMLPFPVLITLFFVFQNTIEFRGVPFLWLPDLSLKDPLYMVPLAMGASMFVLMWMGQRGMESTAQTKMMTYGMPIFMTFLFVNFPSGLNLYYTTSNIASLPQQFYIARERRKVRGSMPSTGSSGARDGGGARKGGHKRKRSSPKR
ncbi:MAG: membrane protein insertase YidC [Gemmatimonadota bacterium]